METYNEIYRRMRERYAEESGAEFDEASDIAIRLKVLAGEVFSLQTNIEWLRRQTFPETATGVFLDRFAEQRGLVRRGAEKAVGSLTFRVTEPRTTAVTIPRGTVVSTDGEAPVRVYTTEDCVLEPLTYSVTAAAEAELPGHRGNINAQSAVVPVSVPAEIDSVLNTSVFHGGLDAESDTTLRARIKNSYFNQPNGMNAAYYIELAKSVDGIVKAGVIPKLRGAGTVNVYVCGTGDRLSNEKLAEVQAVLEAARELNVDVLAAEATGTAYDLTVTVSKRDGYDDDEVETILTDAFAAYLDSIPVGGTLYTSTLGKYLLETNCIETYEFDMSMTNSTLAGSRFFVPGEVDIEVI